MRRVHRRCAACSRASRAVRAGVITDEPDPPTRSSITAVSRVRRRPGVSIRGSSVTSPAGSRVGCHGSSSKPPRYFPHRRAVQGTQLETISTTRDRHLSAVQSVTLDRPRRSTSVEHAASSRPFIICDRRREPSDRRERGSLRANRSGPLPTRGANTALAQRPGASRRAHRRPPCARSLRSLCARGCAALKRSGSFNGIGGGVASAKRWQR
jgi:hypothetical protein